MTQIIAQTLQRYIFIFIPKTCKNRHLKPNIHDATFVAVAHDSDNIGNIQTISSLQLVFKLNTNQLAIKNSLMSSN